MNVLKHQELVSAGDPSKAIGLDQRHNYGMSLILPGKKPDCVTTTGSEVQKTLQHPRH